MALDLETGETVVIKFINRPPASVEHSRHLIRDEAEVLRSLADRRVRYIPRLIDYFEEQGQGFLVQEYLEGVELGSWQEKRPTVAAFFDVYAKLVHTIERLHEGGLVHRDIKPSNVLVVVEYPYLLDFGLSARRSADQEGPSSGGEIAGTPLYMAPEMILGSTQPEGSSDVFSLGMMLYEGMTGHVPLHGGSGHLLLMRVSHDLSSQMRFPELGLPASVVGVFQAMLSIDPSRRPSASKVATALHAAAALARLEHKSTTIPLEAPPPRDGVHDVPATTFAGRSNDLHLAALRIAELEAHLERTTRLTESIAFVVKDLGDKLHPEAFQAMVRQSVLVVMRDIEMPDRSSEALQAARDVVRHLAGGSGRPSDTIEDLRGRAWPPRTRVKKHAILFLAANPGGTDSRALDREARAIQVELERSGFRDRFEFMTRWAAEPLDLLRELRRLRPTVVHFSGHGRSLVDEPRPDVARHHEVVADSERRHGLLFRASDGRSHLVSAAALEETFGAAGATVEVVVFNACYNELQATGLLGHVSCIVGMGGSIGDDAARSFAIGFYGGLGELWSVADAYKQGCAAMRLEGLHASEHPQLKVRTGIDPTRLILAADPP